MEPLMNRVDQNRRCDITFWYGFPGRGLVDLEFVGSKCLANTRDLDLFEQARRSSIEYFQPYSLSSMII